MFHSVDLRAYCHATEEAARVEKALRILCLEASIDTEATEGHHGNPIVMLKCRLQKDDAINAFWRRVKDAGLLEKILDNLDERIDEDAVLHLRFNKQKAYEGSLELAKNDDVIVARAKIAAHPAKKSVAARIAREYLRRL